MYKLWQFTENRRNLLNGKHVYNNFENDHSRKKGSYNRRKMQKKKKKTKKQLFIFNFIFVVRLFLH